MCWHKPITITEVEADAHGNLHAVEAALAAISRDRADIVVAAGDMINPFPGSADVWGLLQSEEVLYLKGNQEVFLEQHAEANDADPLRASARFMPVRYNRRSGTVALFPRRRLPLSRPHRDKPR